MTREELIQAAHTRAEQIESDDVISAELLEMLASRMQSMLWQPIGTAPLGKYETKRIQRTDDKVMLKKQFVPQWVLVWRAGDIVRLTHWLPDMTRWNGFAREAPPTHWLECELPSPPGEIDNEPQEAASGLGTSGTI